MDIDLNLLKIFVSVATQESFAGAAKQLSMPSSNISRGIKQLESQLNCRLIERTTRRMRLTESGAILLKHSQKLYNDLDMAIQQISHADEITGTLRITIPSEAGSMLLADLLAEFALLHPQLSIHCDTQLMPLDVIGDDIDLLLTFHRGVLEDSSYHSRLLKSWESVVVASPTLIQQVGKPKNLTELANKPCISSFSALDGQPWIFIDSHNKQKKVHINSRYRVNSGVLASRAAINGIGFAILSLDACNTMINTGELEVVSFDGETPAPIELRAVYASRRALSPKIDAFLSYIQQKI